MAQVWVGHAHFNRLGNFLLPTSFEAAGDSTHLFQKKWGCYLVLTEISIWFFFRLHCVLVAFESHSYLPHWIRLSPLLKTSKNGGLPLCKHLYIVSRVYKGKRVSNGTYTNGEHRWESNMTSTWWIASAAPHSWQYTKREAWPARAVHAVTPGPAQRFHSHSLNDPLPIIVYGWAPIKVSSDIDWCVRCIQRVCRDLAIYILMEEN